MTARLRIPRVYTYYDSRGYGWPNIEKLRVPFRLMTNVGDWCEMEESSMCIAGNVASLCSYYSKLLGRRFSFSDMKNGMYRIKVMAEPVAGRRVTSAVTGFRRVAVRVTR